MLAALWTRLNGAQYRYVLVNTLVSVVAFGRNLMFMNTLGLGDLGQVALMQTIVMLIGFVQVGMINGTYILYAERDLGQRRRIVNLMWLLGLGLAFVTVLAAALGAASLGSRLVARETLLIGTFAGVATLASTWLNNMLIAEGALGRSNIINITAVMVSLGVAFLSLSYGLPAALLSILVQPLIVTVVATLCDRHLRPDKLGLDSIMAARIFRLGIMPFVGMLFVLGTYQVERWAIVLVLGDEALGLFYPVMMYMTIFVLVPVSLLNVHFPRALRAYQADDFDLYLAIVRRHLLELLAYCAIALIATVAVLPTVLLQVFPQFESSQRSLFLVFPAMLVFVLRDTAALVLYSVKRTSPILISGALLLGVYSAAILFSVVIGEFSIELMIVLRGGAVLISTAYLFWARQSVLKERLLRDGRAD